MAFQIVCQSYEETAYRVDELGEAVKFVDWHRNEITLKHEYLATPKLYQPEFHQRVETEIEKVKKLENVNLLREELNSFLTDVY